MRTPLRTPFLVALVLPALGLAACADDDRPGGDTDASGRATTSTTGPESETGSETDTKATTGGRGTFVVGDRTYAFEAKRCIAEEGEPVGTVQADGGGAFDSRRFTVTVKSSPGETSVIETIQVVFSATEAVVGTNFVPLPGGAADTRFEVTAEGQASGTIAVQGTGGQPSGEGTLTLECEAS